MVGELQKARPLAGYGLSQDQVADAAGLQTASYSRVERAESDDVMLSTLEKIATGLGVGVLELLDGIDS